MCDSIGIISHKNIVVCSYIDYSGTLSDIDEAARASQGHTGLFSITLRSLTILRSLVVTLVILRIIILCVINMIKKGVCMRLCLF